MPDFFYLHHSLWFRLYQYSGHFWNRQLSLSFCLHVRFPYVPLQLIYAVFYQEDWFRFHLPLPICHNDTVPLSISGNHAVLHTMYIPLSVNKVLHRIYHINPMLTDVLFYVNFSNLLLLFQIAFCWCHLDILFSSFHGFHGFIYSIIPLFSHFEKILNRL